jgi:hypothetical protein
MGREGGLPDEALMELVIVLIFFVPILLLGAGLEWMARQEPRGAVITFLMGDWDDDLERGSDGDDAQLANAPVSPLGLGYDSADSTSGTLPQGPLAGSVFVAGDTHDMAGQQTGYTDLGGLGHEAVSLEMFGRPFDGGARNDTRSERRATTNVFDQHP